MTNRPILRKSAGTGDGGLIRASIGADSVSAAIRVDGSEVLRSGAWVVGAVGLDDVVFGLRRVDPAVDGEVGAGAAGGVLGGVGDVATMTCY